MVGSSQIPRDWCLTLAFAGGRRSEVHIGSGALGRLPRLWRPQWHVAALVGDHTVLGLYGERVAGLLRSVGARVVQAGFPPGEAHKTRQTKRALEDRLLEQGLDRSGCVVALGGGISLDLAGYVAATFMRGVDYLSVPTSLLAQVDAAVGGKTGVNTARGKNLVGAFHQPAAVLIDGQLLATLPADQWPNGLAEMVKHAVIADPELLIWIEQNASQLSQPGALEPYPLQRCVEIKAGVVQRDEREHGLRATLNFGHTVGHALERATDHELPHGLAVALGMVVEARLAQRCCGLAAEDARRVQHVLQQLGIPLTLPTVSARAVVGHMGADKKRRGDGVRMALPCALGQMAGATDGYTVEVERSLVRKVLRELAQ